MKHAAALLILAASAAAFSQPSAHSRTLEHLRLAEAALAQGDAAQAEAYAVLVSMPVITYELPSGAAPQHVSAADKAEAMWERALHGSVDFQRVAPGQGSVRVRFEQEVILGGRQVAGRAIWSKTAQKWAMGGWSSLFSATVHVRTVHEGLERSEDELAQTLAHEFGHLLGLADSANPEDLMGPCVPGFRPAGPSYEEAAALDQILARAEQVRFTAQAFLGTSRTEG